MLAIVAFVVFVIGAVVAWVDKTISTAHLLAIAFIGLAFLALHLSFRLYNSASRL